MHKKRLYRSNKDILVAGVLSGIAEYFDHDPTLYRLAFVVLLILTGFMPGVLFYVIGWVLLMKDPNETVVHEAASDSQ